MVSTSGSSGIWPDYTRRPPVHWQRPSSYKPLTAACDNVRYAHRSAAAGSRHREDKTVDKATLIDGLNHDLAGELSAVIQYLTYAARATGPHRPQLAAFFSAEIPDEIGHAQYLAKKIVALGGTPTTVARDVPAAKTNREMMEAVLAAEKQAIADYSQRAKDAEEFGDKGLQVQLEDIVRDESGHYEETQQILRDWELN